MPRSKATSIADRRVLVEIPSYRFVGGKGGVGKTTCAAALGSIRAARGELTLVISTDPAPSLGDALRQRLGAAPRPVRGVAASPCRRNRCRRRARIAGSPPAAPRSRRSRCAAPGSIATTSSRLLELSLPGHRRGRRPARDRESRRRGPLRPHHRRHRADRASAAHARHAGGARRTGAGVRSHAGEASDHGRRAPRRLDVRMPRMP